MGRQKGSFTISDEKQQILQRARKRRALGYTRHLRVAEKMAIKKIEQQFDQWNISSEETLFTVDPLDWEFEPILELEYKVKDLVEAVRKTIEYMNRRGVKEVGICCSEERVLAETEKTGWLVFIKKRGSEYLVETYKEWNEHLGDEGEGGEEEVREETDREAI